MKRSKYIVFAVLSAFVLVGALLVLVSPTARAQVSKIKAATEVLIVNTPAEAVPIQGSVEVSNLGTETVSIRNVDEPARQAVKGGEGFAVPEGKRLVVEYVSAEVRSSIPCNYVALSLLSFPGGSAPSSVHQFYPQYVGQTGGGDTYRYGLSSQVTAYVEGGNSVGMGIAFDGCGIGTGVSVFRFSGYLIDVS